MTELFDMTGFAEKAKSDIASGKVRYTADGKPYSIPSYSDLEPQRQQYAAAAEAAKTERLTQTMREVNAGDARLGNALSFPEAGMPKTWEAAPRIESPTAFKPPRNVPKFTLPELPNIPPSASKLSGLAGKGASLLSPIGDALAIADLAARAGGALLNLPASVQGMAADGALAGRDVGKFLDARRDRLAAHPEQAFPFDELLQHLPFIPRKKSSNVPDYLEPRGQRIPVGLFPVGTLFEVTVSGGGRNDVYRVRDLSAASASPTGEDRFGLKVIRVTIRGSDGGVDGEFGFTDTPSISTAIIPEGGGAPQPIPTPSGASTSPGDAPSIPQSEPFLFDPTLPAAPQPKPRSTPKPSQAPKLAASPAPTTAPRREPSRAPAPAPASKPLPAPAAQPAPAPQAEPTSTPGQSPAPSTAGGALRSQSLNPDRFPDSKASTENAPLRAPSLNPDRFPDPAPSQQPDAKSPASPNNSPSPTIDPTAQPKAEPEPQPLPNAPRQCSDPCVAEMQAQQDQNKPVEIKVKVFKACKTNAPTSGTTGTTGTAADEEKATYEEKTLKVPKQEADTYKLLYERIAKLEALQCEQNNAIAAVPEWWQIRPEAQRSQLVVLFAEVKSTGKLGDSRWTLAIPHYNRGKGFKPKIPDYNKGSWEGILVLKDNSKIIVNAKDRTECTRVINALKINVPVEYRVVNGKAIKAKIGERVNSDLKECRVTAIRADFFSTGQRNLKPDWSIDLRKK